MPSQIIALPPIQFWCNVKYIWCSVVRSIIIKLMRLYLLLTHNTSFEMVTSGNLLNTGHH